MSGEKRVVVIGAGIGGLTAAALLAKDGFRVTVVEANPYPGGSAATFTHKGFRFDAGATLAGGLHRGGPLRLLEDLLDIRFDARPHDLAWTVHLPDMQLRLGRDGCDILRQFPASESFWREQARVADSAWALAARGLPFPPADAVEALDLARLAISLIPRDLNLIRFGMRPVADWLRSQGLGADRRFRRFIDSQLLISAQATADRVNAFYGATALDLPRQGVCHIPGGIGALSHQLASTLKSLGGDMLYRHRARRIIIRKRRAIGLDVSRGKRASKSFPLPADLVIANTTPWSLCLLLGDSSPARLTREIKRRRDTQGAFVLHIGLRADALNADPPAHHHIVTDYAGPLTEGKSLFVSLSPAWDETRAPSGFRAVTVSTHTRVEPWWTLLEEDGEAYADSKAAYAEAMIESVDQALPGFKAAVELLLPGTPITYQFYTGRHKGMVGGFPQSSILAARGPQTGIDNLLLVGDSIFPGQSTAAVALGAMRVAKLASRKLRRMSPN